MSGTEHHFAMGCLHRIGYAKKAMFFLCFSDEDVLLRRLSASQTNANVLFGSEMGGGEEDDPSVVEVEVGRRATAVAAQRKSSSNSSSSNNGGFGGGVVGVATSTPKRREDRESVN